MYNVYDFIGWALTHADPNTIPKSATFPVSSGLIGVEPAHYLYGTVWRETTAYALNERYTNYYSRFYSRAEYDEITADWKPTDHATDCQGLLDAWLTYEVGEKTDINADMNYRYWCKEKGSVALDRPYVIGEALFMQNNSGKMTHVGWVCGFTDSGEPLVVEARGIKYGVVITRFNSRNWTHRGLMLEKFDYTEPVPEKVVFEVASPYKRGEAYLAMQKALDAAGYTDSEGNRLEMDGVWGVKSQEAFDALVSDYAKPAETPLVIEFTAKSENGYALKATVAKLKEGDGV